MESFSSILQRELIKYDKSNGDRPKNLHNRTVKLSPINIDLHNYLIKVNNIIKYKRYNRGD